jgi:hypothetical protein
MCLRYIMRGGWKKKKVMMVVILFARLRVAALPGLHPMERSDY